MRRALSYIEEKQRAFSKLPFFAHLRNQSVAATERLAFVPAGAPFIMAFSDLNKYTLYVPNAADPVQKLLNVHSEEDATHYKMYLKDLATLGFDTTASYSDTLRFLWADERKHCRQTCYLLTALLASATSNQRLVIVEAIEAAGAAAFDVFSELADEFRTETGKELIFFGRRHKDLETGHTMGTEDIEQQLQAMQLSDEESARARELVDNVFDIFSAMMQELLTYIQSRDNNRTTRG
jgi:hypothetical protein